MHKTGLVSVGDAEGWLSAQLLQELVAITTAISEAHDKYALFDALNYGCLALGFDVFSFSCHQPREPDFVLNPTFTNVEGSFRRDYEQFNWFEADPHAKRILSGSPPFHWDTLRKADEGVTNRSFLEFIHSVELCRGMLIPLSHLPGTVSVIGMVTFTDRPFKREVVHAATIMANAALTKAEILGLCSGISADEAIGLHLLSQPQAEILKWISEGKSNLDIATIMGLRERTVRYHVTEILRKLSVATRTQASVLFRSSRLKQHL